MAKQLERKVQQHLSTAGRELTVCEICRQENQPLFGCSFNACNQSDRMLCQRCGQFTHPEGSNHSFDTTSNHIHPLTITLELDSQSKGKIKEMNKSMQDRQDVDAHVACYSSMGAASFRLLRRLDVAAVAKYVMNKEFVMTAFNGMSAAVKSGNVVECVTNIKSLLFGIGDFTLEATQMSTQGAFGAGVVLFCGQVVCSTWQFARGNISLEQYGKDILGAATVTIATIGASIGGQAAGALLGTMLCPMGVGMALGGVLGGFLGALIGAAIARKGIEHISWFNDQNEDLARDTMIKEALIAFSFTWKDINNPDVFNEYSVAQMYRTLAKVHHPDRPSGRVDAFQKLCGNMALLLEVLGKSAKMKTKIAKQIEAITLPTM